MKNKLTKYVIRILAGILGILTIAVTLFLFLYIFWKGKNVMNLRLFWISRRGYRLEQQVESIRH